MISPEISSPSIGFYRQRIVSDTLLHLQDLADMKQNPHLDLLRAW